MLIIFGSARYWFVWTLLSFVVPCFSLIFIYCSGLLVLLPFLAFFSKRFSTLKCFLNSFCGCIGIDLFVGSDTIAFKGIAPYIWNYLDLVQMEPRVGAFLLLLLLCRMA